MPRISAFEANFGTAAWTRELRGLVVLCLDDLTAADLDTVSTEWVLVYFLRLLEPIILL